jgi:predicted aminopeptidase
MLCGCQTAHYYKQAIGGEFHILKNRQPIGPLLANPETDPKLKKQFDLVLRLRAFAETQLHLPVNKHYTTYVDLHRRFAIWNVHATPEFSLRPKKWWYPFVGSLKYRGYFSEPDARQYGARLTQQGDDVYVEGVEAYSTLGWFADPLLNTFVNSPEPDLAEILFHELAHQRLFFSGDTDFNEAFATVVAEEAVRRWLVAAHNEGGYQEYATDVQRNRQFVAIVMHARRQLQALYGEDERGRPLERRRAAPDPAALKEGKQRVVQQLRAEYEQLKKSWGGYSGYDGWFNKGLNNAQLNTIAVYYELVPGFKAVLQQQGGDLEKFYEAVRQLHRLRKEKRHERLLELGRAPDPKPR